MKKVAFFWFRRDLRLEDNTGLYHALESGYPVVPVFIFDEKILKELEPTDKRVEFIYNTILKLDQNLKNYNSSLLIKYGDPVKIWAGLLNEFDSAGIYLNNDYEPYAIERDEKIKDLFISKGLLFFSFKDQVIFEKNEIIKKDNTPYTVFTPYKNKWLATLSTNPVKQYDTLDKSNFFYKKKFDFPSLKDIGFKKTGFQFPPPVFPVEKIVHYHKTRDFPALDATTYLGLHFRFGTISIREAVSLALLENATWLNELVWREFFMMILYHFPSVVHQSFKEKYNNINWINSETDLNKWCNGMTGFPLVDAGMRQLNETGFMHNRVRMVTASFLTKNLLIDWRWGENYFAKKLLDFELSSNNGNWQWAASTGCDAVPYFRIFNPELQLKKFDPELKYVKKWVPEYDTKDYPEPILDISFSRKRALLAYKQNQV